ncbi:hypothetical protein [Mangrovicoccus sp. HB161399]|uniref:alginate O-acetyltransferase AlgX-related protein n=1 Tax=Mangrovicoccus sp. HB161399 TaxID=2720392 RepID=UPI00155643E3|nr:hypothetical protein [Mangrovicoccus sp. HB161399]
MDAVTASSGMSGVMDNIEERALTGWVKGLAPEQVGLWRDGTRLAAAAAWDRPFPEHMKVGFAGFRVEMPDGFEPAELFSGGAELRMEAPGGYLRMPIWPPVALTTLVRHLGQQEIDIALDRLGPGERAKLGLGAALAEDLKGGMPRLGTASPDQAARVGRDGMLLLHAGSNGLDQLYQEAREGIPEAAAWGALSAARRAKAREAGVVYVQALMPEKNSVASAFDPNRGAVPSPVYQEAARAMSVREEGYVFVDWYHPFRGSVAPDTIFRRKDTHLTTFGAQAAMTRLYRLLERTGLPLRAEGTLRAERLESDLGGRFPEQADETVYLADALARTDGSGTVPAPELVASAAPEKGYLGTMKHWRSPQAPDPRRVLVFGNSFFATGENSTQLSFWTARLFAETKFVWSPGFDWDLVEEFSPDIVIGQTIERFLMEVPAA